MTILAPTAVITPSKIRTRFEETYTSESLNRGLFVSGRMGLARGFRLVPVAGAVVKLARSAVFNDSLAFVPDEVNRLALTILETAEPSFDLAAFAGTRVYFFIYVNYTTAGATSAEYRVVDAAELGALWINSAISLGSVRVPSVGAITNEHCDHATAQWAGVFRNGLQGWQSLAPNSSFRAGFAGWDIQQGGVYQLDTTAGDGDDYSAILGSSVAVGPPTTSALRVSIFDVRENDLLFVRFRIKTQGVLSATTNLNVRLSEWAAGSEGILFSQTYLEGGSVAGFESYGFMIEVPAVSTDAELFTLSVFAFNPPGGSGQYVIDNCEVYITRPDGTAFSGLAAQAPLRAVELIAGDTELSYTDARISLVGTNDGRLGFMDHNTFVELPGFGDPRSYAGSLLATLTEAGYGKTREDSLLRDAVRGSALYGATSPLLGRQLLSGLEPTFVAPRTLSLTQGLLRRESGATEYDDNVVVTAGSVVLPAVDDFYVVYVTTAGVKSFSTFGAYTTTADRIPLFYVEVSVGTIISIVDLRTFGTPLQSIAPEILVGPSLTPNHPNQQPHFTSLSQALLYVALTTSSNPSLVQPRATIKIMQGFTLAASDVASGTLTRNVIIEGDGSLVTVLVDGFSGTKIKLNDNSVLRNLSFRYSGSGIFGAGELINADGANILIEDVDLYYSGTPSTAVWDEALRIPSNASGLPLTLRRCRLYGDKIVDSSTLDANQEVIFEDCHFEVGTGSGPGTAFLALGGSNTGSILFRGCTFDCRNVTALGGNNGVFLNAARLLVDGCRFLDCPLEADAPSLGGQLSNLVFLAANGTHYETLLNASGLGGSIVNVEARYPGAIATVSSVTPVKLNNNSPLGSGLNVSNLQVFVDSADCAAGVLIESDNVCLNNVQVYTAALTAGGSNVVVAGADCVVNGGRLVTADTVSARLLTATGARALVANLSVNGGSNDQAIVFEAAAGNGLINNLIIQNGGGTGYTDSSASLEIGGAIKKV